jgi:putative transposase
MPRRKQPSIPDELLDQLLAGSDPRAALADGGLLDGLKKALAERVLNAEFDHHLDGGEPDGRLNGRNGYGAKTVLTSTGKLALQIPRDRLATFDPQLIAKYQRRFPGFDERIVSMYARGMSTREIQGHLREIYGIDISPDLVSAVTDAVLDEVTEWQNRPLEALYPLIFFDAIRVKVRDEGTLRNKAVHVALGVRPDGTKEILGLWIEQTEGAKFWLRVMNELRNRGVEDVLIAVVDGLKGFPEAITATFPQAQVQTCIVHTIRTQSTVRIVERLVPAWRWAAQRDDVADLQAAFMDDDAVDDELQDDLLVGEARLLEAAVDPVAKGGEIIQHGPRLDLLAA